MALKRNACISPVRSAKTTRVALDEDVPSTPAGPLAERLMSTPPSQALPRRELSVLRALQRNDLEGLRNALNDDPFRALARVSGPQGDSPAIAAVRNGCDPALLQLLIERGAEAAARNFEGHSAIDVVARMGALKPAVGLMMLPLYCFDLPASLEVAKADEERCCAYAACLLAADAIGLQRLGQLADFAAASGRAQLEHLIRHWGGKQVTMLRAWRKVAQSQACDAQPGFPNLVGLPDSVFEHVCEILAPSVRVGMGRS